MSTDQIQNDLKQAQLQRDEVRVSTLRLLLSETHNLEISKGQKLSEQEVVFVVQKEAKKRREAAEGFRKGGREEQAQKEESELKILEEYLPSQINNEELTKIVEASINELGATNLADLGKVMGAVMGKVKGRADGSRVSAVVREKLS